MTDTIQTGIYKLRSIIAILDDSGILQQVDVDLAYLEDQLKENGYDSQKLKKNIDAKHEFRLFYKSWPTLIKWKEFIAEIAEAGEKILEHNVSTNEGFILFIKIKKGKSIYALTGGFGHTELQKFIDYQFGLDILSRLIKTNDKVLRAAKESNFVGGVLGSVKYFRDDYNLNENESFGNYYQELKAKLDKSILKSVFKFDEEDLKRGAGLCDAKSSFTIKKPITFQRAIEIIDALHGLIQKKAIVDLNLIKKLDKSDKALVEKLEKEIELSLYNIYKSKITDTNFEVCHRYFDKYYEAKEFEVKCIVNRKQNDVRISTCTCFAEVNSVYRSSSVSVTNQKEFALLIESTKITSYDENDHVLTIGKLMDHLCAEVKFNKRSYFLFNQEWYLIKPEFVSTLNRQCQDFISSNEVKNLLKNWNAVSESENDFNAKHLGEPDTLVFDKVTPENIEVCDILKWNKEEVFFIHVKEGFNNEMRNLGRQVHIAARRISEDLTSGKIFIGSLYDSLANNGGASPYFIKAKDALLKYTKSEFLDLFEERRPVFVLAVLDSSKKGKRNFSDITHYDSNIAKFCLQQLRQEMRSLGIDLKILEIER